MGFSLNNFSLSIVEFIKLITGHFVHTQWFQVIYIPLQVYFQPISPIVTPELDIQFLAVTSGLVRHFDIFYVNIRVFIIFHINLV